MRKIKVLQFTISASRGGRTQYIMNLWRNIDKKKFQFDFVTFSKDISVFNELLENGCKIFQISEYPETNLEQFIYEFKQILMNQYDVIEIHTSFWKSTIVEELAKQAGIKKIIIHGHSSNVGRISSADTEEDVLNKINEHERIKRMITEEMATDFWSCSEKVSEWLYLPQIPENKIRIIHNTIDTEKFRYDENTRVLIRNDLNIGDSFLLGFVGRLEPVKNISFIIRLLGFLIDEGINAHLLIVGDGSERQFLAEYASESGVSKNVIFAGFSSQVEKYLNAMDVLLLPSFFEGFPIVLMEAQCSGLKCITSEKVTSEIDITEEIEHLSLNNIDEWKALLIQLSKGYERKDNSKYLRECGYDINNNVRIIENLYCS